MPGSAESGDRSGGGRGGSQCRDGRAVGDVRRACHFDVDGFITSEKLTVHTEMSTDSSLLKSFRKVWEASGSFWEPPRSFWEAS
jgi:hypothetical protein